MTFADEKRTLSTVKIGNRYTIGEWDDDYRAYIINDGIFQYYWWDNENDAQTAADAYNAYFGDEWIGEHGYGNDVIWESEIDDFDADMVDLYRAFGAIKSEVAQ